MKYTKKNHGNVASVSYTHLSGNGSPIAGVIGIGACMGMIVYWKRKKARHMHQEIKDDLSFAYQQDDFWNEKVLKKKVKEKYLIIQEAWSKQDLETLKKHLSESLYEQWKLKIEWQQFQQQYNQLDHIQLLKVILVDLHDAIAVSYTHLDVYKRQR